MEQKLKEERTQLGNLGVDEIQNLLRSQKEDTDVDWVARKYTLLYKTPHI